MEEAAMSLKLNTHMISKTVVCCMQMHRTPKQALQSPCRYYAGKNPLSCKMKRHTTTGKWVSICKWCTHFRNIRKWNFKCYL